MECILVLRLKPVLLTFPFHMEALPGNIFSMFPPLTTDQHRFLFCLTFTDLEAPPPHGYSNGGMMSYFLGKSRSDKIAVIGSVSGTMLQGNPDPANIPPAWEKLPVSLAGQDYTPELFSPPIPFVNPSGSPRPWPHPTGY